jgi:hypothetical protein
LDDAALQAWNVPQPLSVNSAGSNVPLPSASSHIRVPLLLETLSPSAGVTT